VDVKLKRKMKKKSSFVIMVCAALMVGTVAFVASCSSDDKETATEWKGCKCSVLYGGEKNTDTWTLEDLKFYEEEEGVKLTSCSAVAKNYDSQANATCSDL
jgi:hypothetical protein